eukprot:2041959-Amphidinium_carterae.1
MGSTLSCAALIHSRKPDVGSRGRLLWFQPLRAHLALNTNDDGIDEDDHTNGKVKPNEVQELARQNWIHYPNHKPCLPC